MLVRMVMSVMLATLVKTEPPDACETMEPSHGGSPQEGPPPFTFYLHKDTIVSRLSAHFAILGSETQHFTGFMVQARDDASGLPVGQFDTGCLDINTMNCFGGFANTAVHLSSEPKSDAHMRWLPDLDFVGNVTFFATVAQSRKVFWVRHPARKLQVILDVA
ncbi:putative defense protein Hdd11 isoform X2 [Homalodisca vitripennis]|uniref:putative defense protein Hdd11 isoform X2 n=1 Tax=Homalodisca vitripennis TaxID=197043 RepID=UPI001EEAE4F9|nr:putative defense protein Hdd11 isoform X2 [Homalodisca vitripennis]XP_046684960.1 putative defense protein Hdd11 isoform X2 [Homalodisca vitripennis]